MCTTVRDSVLKPACNSYNFVIKFELWKKLNITGRFIDPIRLSAHVVSSHVLLHLIVVNVPNSARQFSASTWQTPQRLPRDNLPQKKRRRSDKSCEREKSCRYLTSDTHRRRIGVSVTIRNTRFLALRIEILPTISTPRLYTEIIAHLRLEKSHH